MSATGFHPDPSANAPWTRTMVLTAACAGTDAARAAPAIRANIQCFMLQVSNIVTSIPMTSEARQILRPGPCRLECTLMAHFLISLSFSLRTFAAGPEEAG